MTNTKIDKKKVPKPERPSIRGEIRNISLGGFMTLKEEVATEEPRYSVGHITELNKAKSRIRSKYSRLVHDAKSQTGKGFMTTSGVEYKGDVAFVTYTISCTSEPKK